MSEGERDEPIAVERLTPAEAAAEHAKLADVIAEHDRRYHGEDAPTISDAEYDTLRRRYRALIAAFPALARETTAADAIGARPSEKFAKVRHAVPMLSLGNSFSHADVADFVQRVRRFLDWPADRELAITAEPKIDGLSCSLRYERGQLAVAPGPRD